MPLPFDGLDAGAIEAWLRERDEDRLDRLWQEADRVRSAHVGDEVHLRGLIEISNHCVRSCLYCGIRACSPGITRYRMTRAEILDCAREAARLGYGTVVMQSGEDPELTRDLVADVIRAIKAETGLAITLSLGERADADLLAWKEAGADRFLLRFETSDPALYRRIHPSLPGTVSDRLQQLRRMREIGYEIGSGVMVGIPGQTWTILARDICTFRDLDIDMIGVGPFLPSPATPLGGAAAARFRAPEADQVPNDELTTLKVVALTRLVCPEANLPSTTALATIDPARGRELGLARGANIVMPNVTPPHYRVLYEIYPGKACIHETAQVCHGCMERRILSIGRRLGRGPGGRRRVENL
ncbi:MAG TPA: [FeFe] hydrogenase H-cluster radical SAM maturase HydE [Vicinamibacterales bacterium]|nr:[FeFe] hydrogenase H-cluster radical SAM maturase HydE [Vicinamibacterales bacterium]